MLAGRKQLIFKPRSASYSVAETANIDAVLFAPVMAGLWRQRELKDGTYSYIDFLNILEMINVENENKHRDYEAQRRRANV
jgi:hypothetical protein